MGSSSSKSAQKSITVGGPARSSGTAAVKIVTGGLQKSNTTAVPTLKPDSEVVKSAIAEKTVPVVNPAADEYDEDEEMLMYDDGNDVDNEYGYDDDEYY